MKLSRKDARALRVWAVFAVAANLGIALVVGLALPAGALPLLPILGLMLPLLTTGVLDAAADHLARAQSRPQVAAPQRQREATLGLSAT
jgi:hypothetical protein